MWSVRNRIIDGTSVQNDILRHMPQLNSFTFYIRSWFDSSYLSHELSPEDIQQTLINVGLQNTTSMIMHIDVNIDIAAIYLITFSI